MDDRKANEDAPGSGWGPVLAELNSLSDVFLPLRSSSRIKYLSYDISKCYLVFGASTGSIYIFQRTPLKFLQVLANKDGAIIQISLAPDDNLIGYATSKGLLVALEHNIDRRGNQSPRRLQLSYEHKNAQVTALRWNSGSSRLFAGDDRGYVSVINILTSKARILLHLPTVVIMRLDSKVVQLDFAQNKLVASTLTKCYLCDTYEEQYSQIGKKPRDGPFGACFYASSKTQSPSIYATRPGSRLWEVDFQGTVLNTHQFKDALALPPQPVITQGCESKLKCSTVNCPPQVINFGRILTLGDKYLLTWTENALYVFDPVNASVVLWTDHFSGIREVKCYKRDVYLWQSDGVVRNVRLTWPEKLVHRLLCRHEWTLAAHVALAYPAALSTAEARRYVTANDLHELQSRLLESDEAQLSNCIDHLVARVETAESSSVSSSVSGRSGSTDSYSRHESGVFIVHPSPRTTSTAFAPSDSDDEYFGSRATSVLSGHLRASRASSASAAVQRSATLTPAWSSSTSPFRPVSPGTSLTLPRRRHGGQRPKSASPAHTASTAVAALVEADVDVYRRPVTMRLTPSSTTCKGSGTSQKTVGGSSQKLGVVKGSAFVRVSQGTVELTKKAVKQPPKVPPKNVTTTTESSKSVVVPAKPSPIVTVESVGTLPPTVPAKPTGRVVNGRKTVEFETPLSGGPKSGKQQQDRKGGDPPTATTTGKKGEITFTFPCYPYAGVQHYGLEPVYGSGDVSGVNDYVSVTINTPAVLTELKESLTSRVQSGKESFRQTMEEIEDTLKKMGGEQPEEELLDVDVSGDSVRRRPAPTRLQLFEVKHFGEGRVFPKLPIEDMERLVALSRECLGSEIGDGRIGDWLTALEECYEKLVKEVLVFPDAMYEWDRLTLVEDPFQLPIDDKLIVSKAASVCLRRMFVPKEDDVDGSWTREAVSTLTCVPHSTNALGMDSRRATFVRRFCNLLDCKDAHQTVMACSGPRFDTWTALLSGVHESMTANSAFDDIPVSASAIDPKQMDTCQLLALVKRVMEKNPVVGIDICVRFRGSITPTDAFYACRCTDRPAHWLETYLNKMLASAPVAGSWSGLHSVSTVDRVASSDDELLFSWICLLLDKGVGGSSREFAASLKCSCGYPRPWSHQVQWPSGSVLWQLVKKPCRWREHLTKLCFECGYWPGYLYLCSLRRERSPQLPAIVVQLGDLALVDPDSEYGYFPETQTEWSGFLDLMSKRNAKSGSYCIGCGKLEDVMAADASSSSAMTWTSVAFLLLQHLGPTTEVLELLREVELEVPFGAISVDFFECFLASALVSVQQSRSTEPWQTPSFLGPELYHLFQVERQQQQEQSNDPADGDASKLNIKLRASATSSSTTVGCHWGTTLRLHDDCMACCLPLVLGTSSSVRGVTVLECGHSFHSSCVEDADVSCPLCRRDEGGNG